MPEQKGVNRFERGVNTRIYMISLIVGLLAIMLGLYFFVAMRGKRVLPKADQPHPNSRLVLPASPVGGACG